ncbi:Transcription elongation factor [Pseudomonas chlororaphis subsp. aurantiaca]|nr:Transcription elongation factor [Pseudomonas chlororaphis subsp. aurantiaca]
MSLNLTMHKPTVHQLILDKLRGDLEIAQRAAQTAYEAATHEENIAENKYDTLGLEASYLAAGQARRVEEIRQALALCQNLTLRPYDEQVGIQVGALLGLEDESGHEQWLFLAPDGAGLKVEVVGQPVTVITPRSPLGKGLLGKFEGDELEIVVAGARQQFAVTEVK